jgi:GNAT superfamily N-acetyltransferase
VEDRWQGQGIGTGLTQRLIEEARDKGVRCFYALVKGENRLMLNVLRHLDLPERELREGSVKSVEVGLYYQETLRPRRE